MAGNLESTRYKLVVAYDGTDFAGWQVQTKEKKPTIAGTLQATFARVFGSAVTIIGVSRTDAGVHAYGQVATFTTTSTIASDRMHAAWQAALPASITIRELTPVAHDYNPFEQIIHKEYWYHLFIKPPLPFVQRYGWHYRFAKDLNVKKLERVLQEFVGTHDFRSFCTGDEMGSDTIRTIKEIRLEKAPELDPDYAYRVVVVGQTFMRHMIRRIVGAAVQIASYAHLPVHSVHTILAEKNPNQRFVKAPASGLLLFKIVYHGQQHATRKQRGQPFTNAQDAPGELS